jgi:hypothetical protein
MVVAGTFPDIDLTVNGPQLRVIVKVYRESSLNILLSLKGQDHLGEAGEVWLQENLQLEWTNTYNIAYNRLCVNEKTTDRWDSWGMDWDSAETGAYNYDGPRVVGDYYWIGGVHDLGPFYSGLIAAFVLYLKTYLGSLPLEIRTSPDKLTWSSWSPFTLGFVTSRYFQVRGTVILTDPYGFVLYYDVLNYIATPIL